MPFENVHGNGGLLTTVADLLRWNENFASLTVGGTAFVSEEQRPGWLSDGRAHNYAFGLFIGPYKGVPEVSHGGQPQDIGPSLPVIRSRMCRSRCCAMQAARSLHKMRTPSRIFI